MLFKILKQERKKKGLSQMAFAKLFGVSQQTIGSWETNRTSPDLESLSKLARFFNVSVDYLLGLTDIPYTIDDYIAKQKKTGTQPAADEYSADERKIIDMYRQLSEKDKGKIEGRLEEMLDDEQAATKGA